MYTLFFICSESETMMFISNLHADIYFFSCDISLCYNCNILYDPDSWRLFSTQNQLSQAVETFSPSLTPNNIILSWDFDCSLTAFYILTNLSIEVPRYCVIPSICCHCCQTRWTDPYLCFRRLLYPIFHSISLQHLCTMIMLNACLAFFANEPFIYQFPETI